MKTIDLEKILKEFLTTEAMNANKPDYTFNLVLFAMKEACEQVLEMVVEDELLKLMVGERYDIFRKVISDISNQINYYEKNRS